ncbi:unnamed protein product [Tenebrio molitor]|jgi:hypothetical protein|nr:unnamed protein product [Tenebrio molitor]
MMQDNTPINFYIKHFFINCQIKKLQPIFDTFVPPYICTYRCPKNGALMVPYGVEEITVNVRKMLKKFYWTYLLTWRSLKVALNRSIILKYMYEIVMTATSNRTYYLKVQDHSLPISNSV